MKVHQLTEAIARKKHPKVTIEQIGEYRAKLLQLKHCGPKIRQILQIVDESTKKQAGARESTVNLAQRVSNAMSFVTLLPSSLIDSFKKFCKF